jgi:ferric-dicitrate binding protein FerR (iron transport regulator)
MSENYVTFTAVDFAEDSFFIRWIKHPDEESDGFWESFLIEHPDKREEIMEARSIVSSLSFKLVSMDESSYASVRDELLLAVQEEKGRAYSWRRNRGDRWKQLLKIAAVMVVSLTGLAIYRAGDEILKERDDLATTLPALNDTRTEERINPRGQKSVLILPDGSKVWLSVDSKLTYVKDFMRTSRREVQLEGEAFFSVVHNDSVPFIVHTSSSIRIEVLGTSFNVKSYKEDTTVETTLVDGKVSIDKLEKNGLTVGNLILKPNQRAVYFKGSNTLDIRDVNAQNVSAWRHDYLVFDETPFRDVLTQLERWYDVRIYLPEEEEGDLPCSLTANIQHESLEDVLKLLETSHRITYAIRDHEVFIYGKLCKD